MRCRTSRWTVRQADRGVLATSRRMAGDRRRRVMKVMPIWFNRLSLDRKSTRLNSSHRCISYAVFCLKKITSRHPRLGGSQSVFAFLIPVTLRAPPARPPGPSRLGLEHEATGTGGEALVFFKNGAGPRDFDLSPPGPFPN